MAKNIQDLVIGFGARAFVLSAVFEAEEYIWVKGQGSKEDMQKMLAEITYTINDNISKLERNSKDQKPAAE